MNYVRIAAVALEEIRIVPCYDDMHVRGQRGRERHGRMIHNVLHVAPMGL